MNFSLLFTWLAFFLFLSGLTALFALRPAGAPTPPGHYETGNTWQERQEDNAALRRLSSRALANELVRRIAVSQNKDDVGHMANNSPGVVPPEDIPTR